MRNKYNAKKVKLDGFTFDSKAEARRYGELKLLQKAGKISELYVHPRLSIHVYENKICNYFPDFQYWDKGAKKIIYEDVKGVKTPIYNLKKKLVRAIYGIEIREIKA